MKYFQEAYSSGHTIETGKTYNGMTVIEITEGANKYSDQIIWYTGFTGANGETKHRCSPVYFVKNFMTNTTENSKEVLHTQGEWDLKRFPQYTIIHKNGVEIARIYLPDSDRYFKLPLNPAKEAEANAEYIVKAVNERQKLIEQLELNQYAMNKYEEDNKKLLDSNRELLQIVQDISKQYVLENGRFITYCDGDQLVIDMQTAINNAKNI